MTPNGGFRNDRLSFLLQSEANVTTIVPSEANAASGSGFNLSETELNSRKSRYTGTKNGSVSNVSTCAAKEDNLEFFFPFDC